MSDNKLKSAEDLVRETALNIEECDFASALARREMSAAVRADREAVLEWMAERVDRESIWMRGVDPVEFIRSLKQELPR